MSKTVLSRPVSAFGKSLRTMEQILIKAGAPPVTVAHAIARLKQGKVRRRLGRRMRDADALVLGSHVLDAKTVDPICN